MKAHLILAACILAYLGCTPNHPAAAAVPQLAKSTAAAAGSTTCTYHHNDVSDVNWSATSSAVVYSNAGWSRTLWSWDECVGGRKWVYSFDADCHLRTRLWQMTPSGATTTYLGVVGDRGGTCNARPGYIAWQKNGAMKTWSAAGTQLSASPYTSASPFKWRIFTPTGCDPGGEYILTWWAGNNTYIGFWWAPYWNDNSC